MTWDVTASRRAVPLSYPMVGIPKPPIKWLKSSAEVRGKPRSKMAPCLCNTSSNQILASAAHCEMEIFWTCKLSLGWRTSGNVAVGDCVTTAVIESWSDPARKGRLASCTVVVGNWSAGVVTKFFMRLSSQLMSYKVEACGPNQLLSRRH